jgi:hypothetical protein
VLWRSGAFLVAASRLRIRRETDCNRQPSEYVVTLRTNLLESG